MLIRRGGEGEERGERKEGRERRDGNVARVRVHAYHAQGAGFNLHHLGGKKL
jgi:hypothetical protein